MGLNDFIHALVHNPKELMRYKQNPAHYLEQPHIGLSPEEKAHLLAMHQPLVAEVSTVMRVAKEPDPSKLEPPPQDAAGNSDDATGSVNLSGIQVEVLSRAHVFLAEATNGSFVECRLLTHSYIHMVGPPDMRPIPLALNLNICYIDPKDKHDRPQVLNIKTEPMTPLKTADQSHVLRVTPEQSSASEYILNLSDVRIKFYADCYVLLRPDEPVPCVLISDSYYDQSTGSLSLSIRGLLR